MGFCDKVNNNIDCHFVISAFNNVLSGEESLKHLMYRRSSKFKTVQSMMSSNFQESRNQGARAPWIFRFVIDMP